ncbi:tetratricopeptide repeat protein [Nostoc sp. CHAB 5834]|nr:tetratricopeptide repeat protein [Nostoc sp. CHAB 5834]
MAHLKSGNLDAVIECFGEALLLNPNFAEIHNTIGLIQFQIEKYENAIQLFDNAFSITAARIDAARSLFGTNTRLRH